MELYLRSSREIPRRRRRRGKESTKKTPIEEDKLNFIYLVINDNNLKVCGKEVSVLIRKRSKSFGKFSPEQIKEGDYN